MENNTAWITSCKLKESGWLVNGNMCVPNDPANRDCADVLAWIAEGNTPAPEFTDAEIAANTQAELNVTSRAYLASQLIGTLLVRQKQVMQYPQKSPH